jgi:hypothetical protein
MWALADWVAFQTNVREDFRNPMRAYHCEFCDQWHIARAITPRAKRRIVTQHRRRAARLKAVS